MKVALSTHNIFHIVLQNHYLCNTAVGIIPDTRWMDTNEDLEFNPNKKCKRCWYLFQRDLLALNDEVYLLP